MNTPTLEFTKNGNLPLQIGSTVAYAMALPIENMRPSWGIFPDDRKWQDRMAINQETAAIAEVRTGGAIVRNSQIVTRVEWLGDMWVWREAVQVVLRSMGSNTPSGVTISNEGRLPS